MPGTRVTEALARLPHFRTMEPRLLERIGAGCRFRDYQAGQLVFAAGEPVLAFYAVMEGAVRLFRSGADGREQALYTVRPGQSFAEAALLTMRAYPASAQALATPTRLLEVGADTFLHAFRTDPAVSAAMVSSLCMWLLQLVERVEDLAVASAGARLARYLLRLPARAGGGELAVELPMSKKDLAAHLAITPETLSRLLRRWQDQGIVSGRQRRVLIRDARVLTAIADREEPAAGT